MHFKALFVCDDMAKITLVEMGWPGSMHDNWVCVEQRCILDKREVFQQQRVLAWWFGVLGVYGDGSGLATLSEERKYLNTKLAKSVD